MRESNGVGLLGGSQTPAIQGTHSSCEPVRPNCIKLERAAARWYGVNPYLGTPLQRTPHTWRVNQLSGCRVGNLVLRGLEGDRCFYKHAQNKTKDKLFPRINQTLPLSRHPTLGSPASQSRLERFQLCGPQMFHRRSGWPMRQPRGYAVPTLGVLAPAAHC